MARFGESNDGGYLACANLLGGVKSAYSYGIAGYDGWGCDISRRLNVTTHQYDYFPSWAFEVLFINKSIGIVDRARRPQLPNPLDTPSDLSRVDCQAPLR